MVRFLTKLTLALVLTGCALTTPQAFYESSPDNWSDKERKVAFFYALQKENTEITDQGRIIKRDILTFTDILDLIKRMQNDFNYVLQNPDWVDYLLWTGSNTSVNNTKYAWEALYKCFNAIYIQNELADLLNIVLDDNYEKYNQKFIFACPTLAEKLKLDDPRVEEAKRSGSLIPNQIVNMDINTPAGELSLEIVSYIAVQTEPKTPQEEFERWFAPSLYSEIFLVGSNVPIVRMYRMSGNSTVYNLIVVDTDKPEDYGFGLPDMLLRETFFSPMEFISAKLQVLMPKPKNLVSLYNYEREPLDVEQIYIIQSSSNKLEVWEDIGPYSVPVKYKGTPNFSDFEIDKNFVDKSGNLRKVKFFRKRFTSAHVEELYVPKKEFEYVQEIYLEGSLVSVIVPGKPKTTASADYFGNLIYVVYKSADKSYMLWDSDGDGTFDKRKEVVWDW
ncbi:hypothetical protein PGDDIFCJ_00066 [Thermus phage YS40_Isch]|nr:hypothetical protein PGDDIFCJ_00066 [Thermus phage YS40_Isch]